MRLFIAPIALASLMAGCSAPEALAADAQQQARTITVNGEGTASAVPDMAVLNIGVQSDAPTAADALRANSSNMSATIKKLKDLGIADHDIQTSGLSLNPRYNYEKNRSKPEVIGFTASNTVTVRLRDLSKAGTVIDQAVQSGANSLNGISFAFDEPKPLYNEARKNAVADAKAKAELLTDAAGVRLGRLITIQDGYVQSPSPKMYGARLEMAADSAVPMEAGESSITASISMVYEIE
ncbi:SIMPL domain-containing protein [Hyphococcus formosus]|uniref:SIMPL domain-containing protein n=1 Tax=Hyphococcus formosus TaxID=3143534 RepID=UPI00398B74E5